jgi:4-amino-4-deoxy-L-arabinose transferase-like glycosyltransferase
MPIIRPSALLVAVVAALVLLPNLGGAPLWDDDEPRNAACSLAMLRGGEWIVPTFNGRLRVEKPVLVNWLQFGGFAIAGHNETGARLASALLTIGTCLLVCDLGRRLFRPDAGIWAGIVMATSLWTGIAGRAATPDAPLVFCTTLALWAFVRGACVPHADGTGWRHGPVHLSPAAAIGVGLACGLAVLAKGPVGLALPLTAVGGFCWWQMAIDPGREGPLPRRLACAAADAATGMRLPLVLAAAAVVALPWYAAVTLRTDGAWLHDFLLVHNVGRFAAPMEGHSGSLLLYYPAMLLVGTFPWSMAWIPMVRHAFAAGRTEAPATAVGMRLMACWLAAWLVPFSLSGTKLPGYVWPAYPAIAAAAGLFLADWIRRPSPAVDGWMRIAWACLAVSGGALAVGLPIAAGGIAPDTGWLGVLGLVPLVGGVAAWSLQQHASRAAAATAWAATACGTVGLLVALAPAAVAHAGGTRHLVADLAATGSSPVPIASLAAPASAVFYAGRIAPAGHVPGLDTPADAAAFVATHPGAHLVIDARFEDRVTDDLPAGYGVLRSATSFPTLRQVLLIGPRPATPADARVAITDPDPVH